MKDNWKEKLDFNFLQDGIIRVTIDNKEIKSIVELYLFIESLLAEQKKELIGDLQKALKYVVSVDEVKRLLEESLKHHD